MGRQSLEVILHGDSRGRARVEASQTTLVEWDLVVESDQFHEHAGNQHDHVTGVGEFILRGQHPDIRLGRSQALGL